MREVSSFRYTEEFGRGEGLENPGFDDSRWPQTRSSYGHRFQIHGPLPPGSDMTCHEENLKVSWGDIHIDWQPYDGLAMNRGGEVTDRLTAPACGKYGVPDQVAADWLDLQCDIPGSVYYLRAEITMAAKQMVTLNMGGNCAYRAWVDGIRVLAQKQPQSPGKQSAPGTPPMVPWPSRQVPLSLIKGDHRLLLKVVQPPDGPARAWLTFANNPQRKADANSRGTCNGMCARPFVRAFYARQAIWFRFEVPVTFGRLLVTARGSLRAWTQGREMRLTVLDSLPDGATVYQARAIRRHVAPVLVALRVEAPHEFHAGDALPEPVRIL